MDTIPLPGPSVTEILDSAQAIIVPANRFFRVLDKTEASRETDKYKERQVIRIQKAVGKEAESGMIETWLKKHHLIYTGATRHPFILTIRDGTVDPSHFKTWMRQDYLFVRAFVPFVASVLIKAHKESDNSSDIDVILSGMAALSDEIAWFKREASKWGVSFSDIHPQKANQEYCRFLESLMRPEVDYTVAITAFWVIEAVYQESFAHCLEEGHKTPPELQETCQRWGNEEFGQYCHSLQVIANHRLKKASDDILKESEVVFLQILEHEVEFWNIAARLKTSEEP